MQELEKILDEMKKIKDGNRKEKLYAKYPPNSEDQKVLNAYSQGYEDGTDNFYNAVTDIIRKHLSRENGPEITRYSRDNDGWISVEERLPEDEIPTPKLVTALVPDRKARWDNSETFSVIVDTDVYDPDYTGKWEYYKKNVIAWRPLPEPYRPERKENDR